MQIYRINKRKHLPDLETFGFFLIRCLPFIVFSLSSWLLSLFKRSLEHFLLDQAIDVFSVRENNFFRFLKWVKTYSFTWQSKQKRAIMCHFY